MSAPPAAGWMPLLRSAAGAGLAGGVVLATFLVAALVFCARPALPALAALGYWPLLAAAAILGLTILFLVAASAVAMRGGGGRLASAALGLLVLVYMVLIWWRGAGAGGWTGAALYLVAAAGVAALSARLSRHVQNRGRRAPTDADRRGRAGILGMFVVFLVIGAVAILARGSMPPLAESVEAAPFEVRPVPDRLLFIGLDGLDGGVIQDFAARGAVSRLLVGLRGSATFPLQRGEGVGSRWFWAAVLTGHSMGPPTVTASSEEDDGGPLILSPSYHVARRSAEEAARRFLLAQSADDTETPDARLRRLWEIVALRVSAASIGWPGSLPAAPQGDLVQALVVSERLLPALLAGFGADGLVWPESRLSALTQRFEEDHAALAAEFAMRFPVTEGTVIRQWLWESFLIDGYRWRVARRIAEETSAGAIFVHLPGLDLLRSRLGAHGVDRELLTLLETSEALEFYVRWLDGLLGDCLQTAAGWTRVLLADPGRQAGGGAEGFLVVSGRAARSGCVGAPLTPEDVAPLILDLVGYPPSLEMPGRIPEDCLDSIESPPERVTSYGRRRPARPATRAEEETEIVEHLRSLGYLN